jgi:hypothetical protein
MKQCETCEFEAFKDELTGCAFAELKHEWIELWRTVIPFIGKHFKEYECPCYLEAYRPDDGP